MRHPVIGHKKGIIIWLAAILILAAGQFFMFSYTIGGDISFLVVEAFLSLFLFSILSLSAWYPLVSMYTSKKSNISLFINVLVVGVVIVSLWMILSKFIFSLFLQQTDLFWEASFPYRICEGVFLYLLVILSYFLIITLDNLSEKKAKEAELQTMIRDTELKLLRSQINPHFLFNSLNSVSSLTITDPEKAREMVVKLSEFMRYALSRKNDQPVSLSAELDSVKLYLDIEKVRFGDRMVVEESIDKSVLDVKVPVMLLQPIYENAVKHGVYETTRSVNIKTSIISSNGFVFITITNNYDTDTPPVKGTGTGLSNTMRRLELSYGNKAAIETSKDDGVFTVRIRIPL